MAQNFEAKEAEQILRTARGERSRVPPQDYLRAKAHLLSNDTPAQVPDRPAGLRRHLRQGSDAQVT